MSLEEELGWRGAALAIADPGKLAPPTASLSEFLGEPGASVSQAPEQELKTLLSVTAANHGPCHVC